MGRWSRCFLLCKKSLSVSKNVFLCTCFMHRQRKAFWNQDKQTLQVQVFSPRQIMQCITWSHETSSIQGTQQKYCSKNPTIFLLAILLALSVNDFIWPHHFNNPIVNGRNYSRLSSKTFSTNITYPSAKELFSDRMERLHATADK